MAHFLIKVTGIGGGEMVMTRLHSITETGKPIAVEAVHLRNGDVIELAQIPDDQCLEFKIIKSRLALC